MPKYYVSEWALLRKAELIETPDDFDINTDYLNVLNKEKIISIVRNIRQMFINIYQDIVEYPERFKMPMIEIIEEERTKMGTPPTKALSSKWAPYRFFDVLINILISGYIEQGVLVIENHEKLKDENKNKKMTKLVDYTISNIDTLYSQFNCYGLYIDGLQNYKFTKNTNRITLSYPDNPNLLTVLKWMADKADKFKRRHDFMLCQYRLLQDRMDSLTYGNGADYIVDRLHTKKEQDCVNNLDAAFRKLGYVICVEGTGKTSGEGNYSIDYYENEKDIGNLNKSKFRISSKRMQLYLCIRAKNIQNSAEYIKQCSDELQSFFIPGDKGCGNRANCEDAGVHGQSYVIDSISYWKCGCMTGKFNLITLQPRSEDIADYIKLSELSN